MSCSAGRLLIVSAALLVGLQLMVSLNPNADNPEASGTQIVGSMVQSARTTSGKIRHSRVPNYTPPGPPVRSRDARLENLAQLLNSLPLEALPAKVDTVKTFASFIR